MSSHHQKAVDSRFCLIKGEGNFADGRITAVYKVKSFLGLHQRESVGDRAIKIQLAFIDQADGITKTFVLPWALQRSP